MAYRLVAPFPVCYSAQVSSHATGSVKTKEPVGARGHALNDSEAQTVLTAPEAFISSTFSDEDYDSDEGEFEPDDFFSERNAILADCQKLALMARFYSHPESPVVTTDPCATSRCYFDRPSAPKVESVEAAEFRAQVLTDMTNLKKLVGDYVHPERPVTVSDPITMARCYFDRPCTADVSVEEVEARAEILADMAVLKKLAMAYMHPELPANVTDPSATARCYFDRPSAPTVESVEEAEVRSEILADMAALKKAAADYMHAEIPVIVTDLLPLHDATLIALQLPRLNLWRRLKPVLRSLLTWLH
jgi:hypothetical protein